MLKYVKIKTDVSFGFWKKHLRRMLSMALGDAVMFWRRGMLPVHFTVAGGRKYNYMQRTKGYMIRKARVKGHQRPNVWSGESEREVRRTLEVRTFRGKAVAQGVLRGPRQLFFRNPIGMDKTDELTRIAQDESARLADFAGRRLTRMMDIKRFVRRTTLP